MNRHHNCAPSIGRLRKISERVGWKWHVRTCSYASSSAIMMSSLSYKHACDIKHIKHIQINKCHHTSWYAWIYYLLITHIAKKQAFFFLSIDLIMKYQICSFSSFPDNNKIHCFHFSFILEEQELNLVCNDLFQLVELNFKLVSYSYFFSTNVE